MGDKHTDVKDTPDLNLGAPYLSILNETGTDRKHSTRAIDWYRVYGKRTNVEHTMVIFVNI